jgi:hypothetical protein
MGSTGEAGTGTWRRLLTLSGVAFVVMALLGIVVLGGDTPDSDASAAKVASFYNDHQNGQIAGAFVLAASVPFLALFGVVLAFALWPAQAGSRPVWQVVLLGGSLLTAGAFAITAAIHFALADGADTVSAATLQGLNVLDGNTWVAFNSALGVMMLGAGGSLIPRAGADRIMGWVALVAAIALFIPFADFFALLVSAIWILVMSVMLFRREPVLA